MRKKNNIDKMTIYDYEFKILLMGKSESSKTAFTKKDHWIKIEGVLKNLKDEKNQGKKTIKKPIYIIDYDNK